MRSKQVIPILGLAILISIFPVVLSAQVVEKSRQAISPGDWKGTLSIKKNQGQIYSGTTASEVLSAPIVLRLLEPELGGLLDIPSQAMFGYPLDDVSWSTNRLRFSMDALGPEEEMEFDGFLSSSGSQAGAIVGTAVSASWKGSFLLSREFSSAKPDTKFLNIPVEGGVLPGTLEHPRGISSGVPLIILISGAGTTDRDGNNFNVPGKTDALSLLASALSKAGVASFRFDRRGSGQAYTLEPPGRQTSLDTHAEDAMKVLSHFAADEKYSRIIAAGMNEGAWIGAMAIALGESKGIFTDGLIVLDSSGMPPIETLRDSLANLDEATRTEAEQIIEALLMGTDFPDPSEALSDFFSKGRSEWLASWLRIDPPVLMAGLNCPVLFVIGQKDMQVKPESFERLLAARPNSPARIIPDMNYALKVVENEEDNFNSFTTPNFPVPKLLVDLVAAFAKVKPAPSGTIVYRPDAMQSSKTNSVSQ